MSSAVEVVGKIESEAAAQIFLDAEVGLLRVGVDKILADRISKRLESKGRRLRGLSNFGSRKPSWAEMR